MEITIYRRKTFLQRMMARIGIWFLCKASSNAAIVNVPGKGVFVRR